MAKDTSVQTKFLSKLMPEDVGGEAGKVTFALGNGVKVVASVSELPEEIKTRLMMHGLSQKVGDSASGFSKDRDFHGAFSAMQGVYDNLVSGAWASRTGGGTSDLVQVLAELQGASLEDAQAVVDKMDDATLKTVRGNPTVKKALADLVAKRAKEALKQAGAQPIGELLGSIFGKSE